MDLSGTTYVEPMHNIARIKKVKIGSQFSAPKGKFSDRAIIKTVIMVLCTDTLCPATVANINYFGPMMVWR
eukprot:scaffold149345_cov36-Attheya_sp.AAC.1